MYEIRGKKGKSAQVCRHLSQKQSTLWHSVQKLFDVKLSKQSRPEILACSLFIPRTTEK